MAGTGTGSRDVGRKAGSLDSIFDSFAKTGSSRVSVVETMC